MTEQPTERRADQPLPVLGILHKRHGCGISVPICGVTAEETVTHRATYSIVPPAQETRYQECVVCESMWSEARVVDLKCRFCGQRIRE
jgi:formate dehydrogenase maturation protein FdhE